MSISIYKWTGEAYGITDYIDRTTSLRITYKQPQGAIGYTEAVLDIKCESESEAHGLFPKETKIKILDTARASKGFYDGPNLFVGYVDRHKWDEDNLTLRITLRDYLEFKLEKKLNAALFVDQKPSDIISWLGSKIGITTFKLLPDATDSKYDPVIPFYYVEEGTTVRELLTTIAEALGGKCFLSPGKEPFTLVVEYGCLYNSYNGTSQLSISTTNTKNDTIDYKAKSYAYYEVKINKKKAIYDSFTIASMENDYEVPAEGVGCDPDKPHYITFDNPVLKISDLTFLGDSSLSLDREVWNSNFIDDDPTNYLKNPFKIQVKVTNSVSTDQKIFDFYFTIYTIIEDNETQGKGDLTGTNENTWTLESDMISVNDDWNKRRVTWEASRPVDGFNANIQDFDKAPYIGPKDSVSSQPYYIIDLDGAKMVVEELEYNYSNEVWTLKGNGDRETYDPVDTDNEETNEPKIPENLKNYTAILTNEAHTVLCDSSGNPKTGEVGSTGKAITQVLAFRNAHLLSAVDSSPGGGKFSITVTGEDCTAGKSENDRIYLVSFDSGKDSAKIKIEINLEGKLTVEKYMTLTKAIEGAPGSPGEPGEPGTPGEDAKAGRVSASSQIIVYDNSGNNPTPDTSTDITITATAINFTPTAYKFYKSVNGGEETLEQNGAGNTYTLPVNSGYSGYVYTIKVEFHDASGKQAEDQITVAEVKDGNIGDGNTPAAPTNLATDSDAVGGIFLTASWTKSTSKDVNYYLVEWKKITETWDDANVLAVLENNARLPADRGESYNIRVRAHDYDDLYSAYLNATEVQEAVNGDGIVPKTPTGLSLTSEYVEQQVWLKISWIRSTSKDTSYYEIWLKEDGGSYSKIGETIGTFYRAPVLANTAYYVKLKAVDIEDLSSDYSDEANHTTTNYPNPDDTANINTSAGKTLIFVVWDNIISGKNIEADPKFNYYELERKIGTASLYVALSKQRNNTYTDKSVSYDNSYYYRVRTVSKSGAVGSWIETSGGTSPNRNGVDDLETALRLRTGQQILVGPNGNEAVKIGYDALPDNKDGIYILDGGNLQINISDYMEDIGVDGILTSNTDLTVYNGSGNFANHFEVGDLVLLGVKTDLWTEIPIKGDTTSTSDITIERNSGYNGNFADYFQVGDSIFLDFTDIGGSTYERTITAIDEDTITINAGCSNYGSGIKIYKKINSGDKILRAVTAVGSAIISIDRPIEVRTGYPLTLDVFKVTADKGLFFNGENGDMKVMGDLFVAAKNNKIRFIDSGINLTDENSPFEYSTSLLNRIKFSRKQIYRRIRQELTFDFFRKVTSNNDDYQTGNYIRSKVWNTRLNVTPENYDIKEQQMRLMNLLENDESSGTYTGAQNICEFVAQGIGLDVRTKYYYPGSPNDEEEFSGGFVFEFMPEREPGHHNFYYKFSLRGNYRIPYYSSKPLHPPRYMPCVIYHNSKYWLVWESEMNDEFFQREVFKKTWSEVGS